MTCRFDWEPATVVKTFSGFVSSADFVRSAEVVAEDARFDELKFIVNDFSAIEGHGIDVQAYFEVAISRLGALRTNPNFRVVIVADDAVAGTLRRVVEPAVMSERFDPWFCATMEQARSWIALQPVTNDFRNSGY